MDNVIKVDGLVCFAWQIMDLYWKQSISKWPKTLAKCRSPRRARSFQGSVPILTEQGRTNFAALSTTPKRNKVLVTCHAIINIVGCDSGSRSTGLLGKGAGVNANVTNKGIWKWKPKVVNFILSYSCCTSAFDCEKKNKHGPGVASCITVLI